MNQNGETFNQENQEMVMVAPTQPSGIELLQNAGSLGFEAYYTSLPAPDTEDRGAVLEYAANISRFMGDADYRLSEVIGQVINVTDIFAHKVRVREELPDKSVIYKPAERIVIVDDQGETYEGTADGVFRSLFFVFSMPGIGKPPWTEPLPMIVKQVSVRNTWRTFRLEVVAPNQDTKTKKSRK